MAANRKTELVMVAAIRKRRPVHAVQPCIPFRYVRDGCYARAHQVRRVITTRHGYRCEKVFSYADPARRIRPHRRISPPG